MTISTICDDFPTLTGRQEPHNVSAFDGDPFHGARAVTLAHRARTPLMPWQRWSLTNMLLTEHGDPDGEWVHPDSCLIVPRQNGKSLILVFRILYGLFVLNETIIFTAQQWKTARSIAQRTIAAIKGRPSLRARLAKPPTLSQGEGHIVLKSGAQAFFMTRSGDSGRGLDDVDLLIYDEAYNLSDAEAGALSWVQMAARRPQTIYTSSAVDKERHQYGEVLAAVRRRGLAGGEGLFLAEWMAPEEMDRASLETARYANPSYGVIQTDEKILKFQRDKLHTAAGRREYDVEALGRGDWPEEPDDVEVEHIIDPTVWSNMAISSAKFGKKVALAIDMSPNQKWVSIAAAARTDDGKVHVEVGYHAAPGPGLIRILLSLIDRWDPCALVMDKASPAYSLHPDLVDAGIEPEVTSAGDMVQACGGFYNDAVAGKLTHTGDPLLSDALDGATKRDLTGGGWAWNRKGNQVISPLVAATLAHWALKVYDIAKPPPPPPAAAVPTRPSPGSTSSAGELDVLTAAF